MAKTKATDQPGLYETEVTAEETDADTVVVEATSDDVADEIEQTVENMDDELTKVLAPPDQSEDHGREMVMREQSGLPAAGSGKMDLVALAINRDLDVDKLQVLVDMAVADEERQNKRAFDAEFAKMQSEFEPVRKGKKGDKGMYAPIEDLQRAYDPIISAHGFSYTWNEDPMPDGWIKITLIISGHGHTRTNSKALPPYEPDTTQSGKHIMNEMQAEGVRSSYGRRYTFIAGFGLTIEGEDTDGEMTFRDGVKYAEYINAIESTTTVDDAHETASGFYQKLKAANDTKGMKVIAATADAHKGYLKAKEQTNANH